jgi:GDP-L-fucose synthase
MADACVHLMGLDPDTYRASTQPMLSHINAGTGEDVTIAELATAVKQVIGYDGEIRFDKSKPDGTPRKLLDVARLNALGWRARTNLSVGLKNTYDWFLKNLDQLRT